jgi:hypothetical protein
MAIRRSSSWMIVFSLCVVLVSLLLFQQSHCAVDHSLSRGLIAQEEPNQSWCVFEIIPFGSTSTFSGPCQTQMYKRETSSDQTEQVYLLRLIQDSRWNYGGPLKVSHEMVINVFDFRVASTQLSTANGYHDPNDIPLFQRALESGPSVHMLEGNVVRDQYFCVVPDGKVLRSIEFFLGDTQKIRITTVVGTALSCDGSAGEYPWNDLPASWMVDAQVNRMVDQIVRSWKT